MKQHKNYLLVFLFFLAAVFIFDFIDFLFHGLSPAYSVPERYFRNKEIYGTIIAFITYLFVQKKSLWTRVFIVTAVTTILLQMRYYLEGYPLGFVLGFLVIHALILIFVLYFGFKYVLDPFMKTKSVSR